MRSKKQLPPATFESVWVLLQESIKDTQEIKKENREMKKEMKRESLQMKKEMQKESKEFRERIDEMIAESRRERKELNKQLGGISNSNGEMAEAYFYNAFKANKHFANEQYDHVQQPTKITNGDIEAEFDLLLSNGKSVALVEVKYNAKPDNISVRRLIDKVEKFRILYPNYKNHNIYLGVAAMTFRSGLEERLHRNGIATIHQVGKKMVVYDREAKAF